MEVLGSLIETYGYYGIFIALVLGIVGLPIPDELLLTFVGYNIFISRMTWSGSLFAALLGSLMGITISYLLGIKLGVPFLKKYGPKFHITEKRIQITASYFSRYGGWLLTFGYFLPGIRHVTAYMAGISNFKFGKFAFFAYLGSLIWVHTFILLGFTLGNNWTIVSEVEGYFHNVGIVALILVGVALFVFLYIRRRRKKLGH
ncbi:DedA family protein [Oceanobacillus manasiensis]|uniref:DedA family protein n=1 Tax=Oceanobacillus manasiensis TaxID=586413 RepID=UPI0005A6C277|nr:DedA family protein [Oceanobacillus manasiensis]